MNHNFIKQVAPHLVPVLLQQLTKQDENLDEDDTAWNMSMAAGTCLGLLARAAQVCVLLSSTSVVGGVEQPGCFMQQRTACLACALYPCLLPMYPCLRLPPLSGDHITIWLAASFLQDTIVPAVMPFVTENIGKNTGPDDWRSREAATLAFGSILEGPSPAALADIVRQAMGFLLAVSSLSIRRILVPLMYGGLLALWWHSSSQLQGLTWTVQDRRACHYPCVAWVCRQ